MTREHQQQLLFQHRHRKSFLFTLLLTITIHFGCAFIPFIETTAAMTTDSNSCTKSSTELNPTSTTSLSAANSNEGSGEMNTDHNKQEQQEGPLLLPESNNEDPSIPRIQLGDTISFEEMGPVIINADGTTRRIDNWDKMSKHEQEVAWRRISKRNAERRAALLEQQQKQQE